MTPERWQEVKRIFNSAMQYAPPERNDFLSDACGADGALRSEVESLLASHEKGGSFIDGPALAAAGEFLDAGSEVRSASLQPGQAVGAFEVIAFISRGGMGEVYLAEDRRLNRKVALKLLPEKFTNDSDRLRRFEQEARTASGLNHPNIITIYEILTGNSTQIIATEFVEGETLRQRLGHSQLSLTQALHIGIQVADALTAAHQAGIIHRDIKPENIMLRPDGYVKVLDFGLAKLSEESSSELAAEALTRQVRTGSGMVIGTPGYMSPEQARGRAVDARSDIFSLGAVIYEMVAHRKPFEGETPSDTLAAILRTEPLPLAQVVPEAPPELVRIVTKALRKDREERYQVVKELLIDLRSLKQDLDFQKKGGMPAAFKLEGNSTAVSSSPVTPTGGTAPQTSEMRNALSAITESLSVEIKRHRAAALAIALALVLAVVAGIFGIARLFKHAPTHFQAVNMSRLTNSGKVIDATMSPDGNYVVYSFSDAGKQSIWIRQVNTPNDKLVVPPAPIGLFGMTVSPDNQELYYAVKANLDRGTLYRVPIQGGTPQKVLEGIEGPVSFSPDGKQLVLLRNNFPNQGESSLVIANADGSSERTLVTKKAPERFAPIFFAGPSWSPDGKLIATAVQSTDAKAMAAGSASRVSAFAVADGKEEILTRTPWLFTGRVGWLSDMSGLVMVAGDSVNVAQVWLLSYPDGVARKLTNDLNAYRAVSLTEKADKFTTIQSSGLVNLWVVPNGDAKQAIQLPTGNVGFYSSMGNGLAWTPDGRIVFVSNESGNADIWLMDPDGSNRKQLTRNGEQNFSPEVSADGHYIVFASTRGGARRIWRIDIDGGNPQALSAGPVDAFPTVSADGKWVLFAKLGAAKWTVARVPLAGGAVTELSSKPASGPTISPDNKLVAYLYPDSPDSFAPANRIGVMSIDGGEPIKTFSFQGSGTIATMLRWSADGTSLLYTVNNNNVTNVWSQPLDGSPPKQVTDFRESLITSFAYSRDGKLACLRGVLMRDAVLISEAK